MIVDLSDLAVPLPVATRGRISRTNRQVWLLNADDWRGSYRGYFCRNRDEAARPLMTLNDTLQSPMPHRETSVANAG